MDRSGTDAGANDGGEANEGGVPSTDELIDAFSWMHRLSECLHRPKRIQAMRDVWSNAGAFAENLVGDFNGDGRDDLLQFVSGTGWRVALSTGTAFSNGTVWSNAGAFAENL
ncbi:MAG: hypothetical protein KC417_10700, partial [Myxococcales bacterium]|nr:hypothetical protein [Myxococcales bacterium]